MFHFLLPLFQNLTSNSSSRSRTSALCSWRISSILASAELTLSSRRQMYCSSGPPVTGYCSKKRDDDTRESKQKKTSVGGGALLRKSVIEIFCPAYLDMNASTKYQSRVCPLSKAVDVAYTRVHFNEPPPANHSSAS